MHLPHLKKDICDKINNKQNINTVSEAVTNFDYAAADKFTGIYNFVSAGDSSTLGDGSGANSLPAGLKKGCIYRAGLAVQSEPYTFFNVLIDR
jgi:hypothetical protein